MIGNNQLQQKASKLTIITVMKSSNKMPEFSENIIGDIHNFILHIAQESHLIALQEDRKGPSDSCQAVSDESVNSCR